MAKIRFEDIKKDILKTNYDSLSLNINLLFFIELYFLLLFAILYSKLLSLLKSTILTRIYFLNTSSSLYIYLRFY